MITHTKPVVEPAPTIADYPDTMVTTLYQQARHALRHGHARLGPHGPYCSPAALRAIRDTCQATLRDRAARLDQRRTQWLAEQSAAQLGRVLATRQTSWIPFELREVITWQTLRDELHTRAAVEYATATTR